MTDNINKKERSSLMSKIKSKETKLEKNIGKILTEKGIKHRKNSSKHFGKPDIVIASRKTVIFIDSCFWHGCETHCRIPKSNHDYWVNKISNNKERDKKVNNYYKEINWNIIRIWEHKLKNQKEINKIFNNLK